jgi:UDP-N-acetylmuramoyl-tripeptide--D-alanyl-D-alanine ligase
VSTDSRSVAPARCSSRCAAKPSTPTTSSTRWLPRRAWRRGGGSKLPENFPLPALVVPDTLVALGRIGNAWRSQFAIPVIGVTGSNGKTTVKEMIASILAAASAKTRAWPPQGNLNNEIGVPLTVMRLSGAHKRRRGRTGHEPSGRNRPPGRHRRADRRPGQQRPARAPGIHAHRGSGGARERLGAAALPADGVAVFPGDDEYTALWRGLAGGAPC